MLSFVAGYYYVTFGRLIDAQLHGERQRVFPRIFARPLELRLGQAMTERQLIDRLNDIGYAERSTAAKPGEFALDNGKVSIVPRAEEFRGRTVKVSFQKPAPPVQKAARAQAAGAASAAGSCRNARGRHRPERTPHARYAAAQLDTDRTLEATARGAVVIAARTSCRRCWRSRIDATTTIRASIRSG